LVRQSRHGNNNKSGQLADRGPEMADQHPSPADDALDALHRKVQAARASHAPEAEPSRYRTTGMAKGMRMASEFVSAIAVGTLLGYGLDWLLGSQPVALLIGLSLGFVTGVVMMVRSAREMATSAPVGNDLPPSSDDGDDRV
jgi:ATP synthase protein I